MNDILKACQVAVARAPRRPDNTCPDIDKAIDILKGMEKSIDVAIGLLDDADLDNPFGRMASQADRTIDKLIDMLEELRSKNSALRENGSHFYDAVVKIGELAEQSIEMELAEP